jgi:hypothetical protein
MNVYNYFLKARVSLRALSSHVINLFTQVAIVLELALVCSQETWLGQPKLLILRSARYYNAILIFEILQRLAYNSNNL